MSTKKMIITILTILLLIVSLTSCKGIMKNKGDKVNIGQEQSIPVRVEETKTSEIYESYTVSAKTKGIHENYVIPELQGKVTKVYYEIGDTVKKGDVLYDVEYNITELEQRLVQAKQGVDTSKIAYADAVDNLEKITILYEERTVTEAQYTKAKSSHEKAKAAYETAIETQKLTEDMYYDVSEKTSVESPIDGVVGGCYVSEGNYTPSGSSAFLIVDMSQMEISLGVSEKIVSSINVGQKVDVTINALGNEIFEGEVMAVSPVANFKTSKYEITVMVDNANREIYSGMFSEVNFKNNVVTDSIVISSELINYSGTDKYVYIVEDEFAREVYVETGIETKFNIEIIDGLSPGQLVITDGYTVVKDGDIVNILDKK